ncbi:hybrid sensor histidine kinase/response regulator [Oscillatoria salina]|uniref:hybrid sensor histidine kinase/response regulator n=1 Tax=Oscillatoria salina TaxID=331517 RepID=UPI0013B91FBB|nr:hybrid sensor histidine kinase/response regulator [Oscillatoria salina]MBZ8182730.1 response regulator [Oscillatoria salina IIICB1]NET91468.1 response regulator [Kamptonema sp. SIO1D9]
MLFKKRSNSISRRKSIPLYLILVVPFLLQIFAIIGLTGYISLRKARKATDEMIIRLGEEIADRIELHTYSFLEQHHRIHQSILASIEGGRIDVNNFAQLECYFWEQVKQPDVVDYLIFGNPEGNVLAIQREEDGQIIVKVRDRTTNSKRNIYQLDDRCQRGELLGTQGDYDVTTRPWYQAAIVAGTHTWGPIYPEVGEAKLETSPVVPIYTSEKELIGVLGMEISLEQIADFLRDIHISPSGVAFIVDRSGEIVASSTSELPLKIVKGKTERLQAIESSQPIIRATSQKLIEQLDNFEQINRQRDFIFKENGSRIIVEVEPIKGFHGIDWLTVVAIPEADFTKEINSYIRQVIFLCIFALILATVTGIFASRLLSQSIHQISQASQALASGKLNRKVKRSSVNELDILAQSFNQMADQLRQSFSALELANQQLEQRVKKRTKELEAAKVNADNANRAKSDFLAKMSHELRTPLNAILGFTQLINRDENLSAEHRKYMTIINNSGEHLLNLINDILEMSKIEAGRLTFKETKFDLYGLLDSVEAMLHLKAKSKNLELIFDRASELPRYVQTDESKLRQILINLVGNAIKFTRTGSVILQISVVNTLPQNSLPENSLTEPRITNKEVKVLFAVIDTGAGIKSEEIDKLFQPFAQTETGLKSGQGTGLGLPISAKFVQMFGGEISVVSQPNQGSKFSFEVSLKVIEEEQIEKSQLRKKKFIGLAPNQPIYRILVAEDISTNRLLVTDILTNLGFEVREAENGREAISLWLSWQPDLILMDIHMPLMDGIEATKYIKEQEKFKQKRTPIIALTATAFEEQREAILAAGCNDFLSKPFQEEKLLTTIAHYLQVKYVVKTSEQELHPIARSPKNGIVESTGKFEQLNPESLTVMPQEWRENLYNTACKCDDRLLLQLIQEIPAENVHLVAALEDLVNNYRFDTVMQLAEATTEKN